MREKCSSSNPDVSIARKIGYVLSAMGRGFEAQNTDGIGVRSMAIDVMTGNLEEADMVLKLTPVPDAPPKDLDIR